ncbi:MAG: hypothetical protein DSM106950_23505 [Stigonema ocellatum SAG 48.90 = DSM 106950]|nr:hypothetical protein [Stigonema ocellatum SAG 48.90 = DSM 106950]
MNHMQLKVAEETPFSEMTVSELRPGSALVVELDLPVERSSIPIQVNVDAWPEHSFKERIFIRIRAQGIGCTFRCRSCFASTLTRAINLNTKEIVHQVLWVLNSAHLGQANLADLTIAFMGLGEPLANPNIIPAIQQLRKLLPQAKFIVSTTGPKIGRKIFDNLIALVQDSMDIDLQVSVHSIRQDWRLAFIGDSMYQDKPRASWTVQQLSELTMTWKKATGRLAHTNWAIGPDFHPWDQEDYDRCAELFPPDTIKAKLSLEGPFDGQHWDMQPYIAELSLRESAMKNMGYDTYVYIPDGLNEGGSCGAQITGV